MAMASRLAVAGARCPSAVAAVRPLGMACTARKRRRLLHSAGGGQRAAAWTAGPAGQMQAALEAVHGATGLPWWLVIVSSTVALRGVLTLPLSVYQARIVARLELQQPALEEWKLALREKVAARCRRAGLSADEANTQLQQEVRQVWKGMQRESNAQPWKATVPLYMQLPLWVLLSITLRHMTDPSMLATHPELFSALSTQGLLWIPNLTEPDATAALPVLIACTNLANIELNTLSTKSPTESQKNLKSLFRVLAVAIAPIACNVPSAMALYWATSSFFAFAQNITLRYPAVRRQLGIPPTPSERARPLAHIATTLRDNNREFWADVRAKNFGPRQNR